MATFASRAFFARAAKAATAVAFAGGAGYALLDEERRGLDRLVACRDPATAATGTLAKAAGTVAKYFEDPRESYFDYTSDGTHVLWAHAFDVATSEPGELQHGIDVGDELNGRTKLCEYSIFGSRDNGSRASVAALRKDKFKGKPGLSRAVACMVGGAVGDALGAPFECTEVRFDRDKKPELTEMDHIDRGVLQTRPGEYTDDTAMANCLADSIIVNRRLVPADFKLRLFNWLRFGYNNPSQYFPGEKPQPSKGAAETVKDELEKDFCAPIDEGGRVVMQLFRDEDDGFKGRPVNGVGSLTRNAPIPAFAYAAPAASEAVRLATTQSYTTHNGRQAAEACAALAFLGYYAIRNPGLDKEQLLAKVLPKFANHAVSVQVRRLARGEMGPPGDENHDWRWKRDEHVYAPVRRSENLTKVGSHSLDALAMALHCVWTTNSFEEAVTKAVNRGGDADSVGCITGQIAGLVYGYDAIPDRWLNALKGREDIELRAYRLFTLGQQAFPPSWVKESMAPAATLDDAADATQKV